LLKMVYTTCLGNWLGGGYWNMILAILFWIIVIAIFIWLLKEQKLSGSFRQKEPLKILKERYAKGEITKVKFEQMKKELER